MSLVLPMQHEPQWHGHLQGVAGGVGMHPNILDVSFLTCQLDVEATGGPKTQQAGPVPGMLSETEPLCRLHC